MAALRDADAERAEQMVCDRKEGTPQPTPVVNPAGDGAGNRFWVYLTHQGRQISLGYTTCAIESARRYDAVARELGFPPEKLNFPDER